MKRLKNSENIELPWYHGITMGQSKRRKVIINILVAGMLFLLLLPAIFRLSGSMEEGESEPGIEAFVENLFKEAKIAEERLSKLTAASGSLENVRTHEQAVDSAPFNYVIKIESEEIYNCFIKIQNIGKTKMINPKVLSNNMVDMSSIDSIIEGVVDDSMTEEEKAIALWKFVRDYRYHGHPPTPGGINDPIQFFNVYGYGICGAASEVLARLWNRAGLRSRVVNLKGHVVSEVYYDKDWHLFDADCQAYYLEEDNKTIASLEDLNRNLSLFKRISRDGKNPGGYEIEKMLYLYKDKNRWSSHGVTGVRVEHSMDFSLRSGETLIRYFTNKFKEYYSWEKSEPTIYANGQIIFIPKLDSKHKKQIFSQENIVFNRHKNLKPKLYAKKNNRLSSLIYEVKSPYLVVGGKIGGRFYTHTKEDSLAIYISIDNGRSWKYLWTKKGIGREEHYQDMHHIFVEGPPVHSYLVKFEFLAKDVKWHAGLDKIKLDTHLQLAPLSLPALEVDLNNITFKASSKTRDLKAKITYGYSTRP